MNRKMNNTRNMISRLQRRNSSWKIIIGNINSFPSEYDGKNKLKMDMLKKMVTGQHTDIIMISEHNRNLANMGKNSQPLELVKRWWKNTIVRSSYLISSSKAMFEPGGTMIITTKSKALTCAAGVDKDNLGQWNYITLKGKKEYYTTVISIYRPNKYQETYMRQTAYTAKRRKTMTNEMNPENMCYYDLKDLIQQKKNSGHQVIVAGDFNDDLNDPKSVTHVFMTSLGLKELMITQYGEGGTCNLFPWNQKN